MTRKRNPFAGWQGSKPPGNGVRRPNLPIVIMLLAVVMLLLVATAPIQAAGPRELDQPSDGQQDSGSNTLFPVLPTAGNFAGVSSQPRSDGATATVEVPAPQVTGVHMISTPAVGDTYGLNEVIEIGVTFDSDVVVNGRAFLGMWIGSRWYPAWYDSGSGSDCLVFVHRVLWEDEDSDGLSVPGGYVDENGEHHGIGGRGSIVDAVTGVKINAIFAGMSSDSDHKVDWRNTVKVTDVTVISKPDQGDTYREGEALEVQLTYAENMVVEGDAGVSIYVGDVDGSWRGARYDRGAGTDKLIFSYTVERTDVDPTGFTVAAGSKGSGYFGNGFIRSEATGQYSSRNYRAMHDLADHKVLGSDDLVAPTISSLTVTSTPTGRDYVAGELIRVDIVFDEEITATGSAELELDFDGQPKTAILVQGLLARSEHGGESVSDDTLSFFYEVEIGDHDPDGFAIGKNKLRVTSGSIQDAAGNDAILDHDAVPAEAVQCVDARNSAPEFLEGTSATRMVDENLDSGALVGKPVEAIDYEGNAIEYSLSGDGSRWFTIDSETGQVKTATKLSFEWSEQFSLTVKASDGLAHSLIELKINVTDIDEPGRISVLRPPPVCTPVLHAYVYDPDRDKADHVWTWEISDDGETGWTSIGHVESHESSYSPSVDDANKYLRITVTYSDKFGSGKSVQLLEAIGPVEPLQNGCLAEGLAAIGR